MIAPPLNVWRHFRNMDCNLKVAIGQEKLWLLEAVKAIYGLGDGPLAWQLCLLEFLIEELHGTQSPFDENFIMWFSEYMTPASHGVEGLASCHVDDNDVSSTPN